MRTQQSALPDCRAGARGRLPAGQYRSILLPGRPDPARDPAGSGRARAAQLQPNHCSVTPLWQFCEQCLRACGQFLSHLFGFWGLFLFFFFCACVCFFFFLLMHIIYVLGLYEL